MTITEAQQAVVEYLVTDPEPESEAVRTASPHRGWVAKIGPQRKPGADPSTIRFRKTRSFEGCQLHNVTYSTLDGRSMSYVVRTWLAENGGTVVAPIGGGGADGPHRDHPWVNFTAQLNSTFFRGGGELIGNGAERAQHVRLRFANGTVAEDSVDGGVVLFEVPGPITFPVEVEVVGAGAVHIHTYTEFEGLTGP